MNHENYLVMINAEPAIEEAMVDYLLSLENSQGFTSFPIYAHDHQQNLSILEQVVGRKRHIQFQMYVHKNKVSQLITGLKADFTGSGVNYWVLPVIEHGAI